MDQIVQDLVVEGLNVLHNQDYGFETELVLLQQLLDPREGLPLQYVVLTAAVFERVGVDVLVHPAHAILRPRPGTDVGLLRLAVLVLNGLRVLKPYLLPKVIDQPRYVARLHDLVFFVKRLLAKTTNMRVPCFLHFYIFLLSLILDGHCNVIATHGFLPLVLVIAIARLQPQFAPQ